MTELTNHSVRPVSEKAIAITVAHITATKVVCGVIAVTILAGMCGLASGQELEPRANRSANQTIALTQVSVRPRGCRQSGRGLYHGRGHISVSVHDSTVSEKK